MNLQCYTAGSEDGCPQTQSQCYMPHPNRRQAVNSTQTASLQLTCQHATFVKDEEAKCKTKYIHQAVPLKLSVSHSIKPLS